MDIKNYNSRIFCLVVAFLVISTTCKKHDLENPLSSQSSDLMIRLTCPNGSEIWDLGSQEMITWLSTAVESVKIDLYRSGTFYQNIVDNLPISGTFSYVWNIPETYDVSEYYKVRITSLNNLAVYDESDDYFRLIKIFIQVISPNGDEDWEVGSNQNITWTSDGTSGTVRIEYSTNSGTTWNQIVNSTPDTGTYPWNVPNTPSNICLVKISDIDGNPWDLSDGVFSIFSGNIHLITPNGGEDWAVGSNQNINWTSDGTSGTVRIEYSTDSGATWNQIVNSTPDTGTYPWNVPNTPSNTCLVKVSDTDGSPWDQSDSVFRISNSYIRLISPNGGEDWYLGHTDQSITWSSENAGDYVKIELYKMNNFYKSITNNTPNTGNYKWTIPTDYDEYNYYKMKITSISETSVFDFTDGYFRLRMPNYFRFNRPFEGETIERGHRIYIEWVTTSISIPYVRIELFKGSSLSTVVTSSVPNREFYWDWAIPTNQPLGSDYRYKITSTSNDNYFGYSKRFSILPNQGFVTIHGNIRTSNGAGVSNVTVYGTGVDPVDTIDDGAYYLTVPTSWSGTITPIKSGYNFSPSNKSYTNVRSDKWDQNFLAYPN